MNAVCGRFGKAEQNAEPFKPEYPRALGSLPGLQLQQHLEGKLLSPQKAGEEDGQHLPGACKYCGDKVKVAGGVTLG